MGRVSGKVAIVTGAARGMGAAHARRLIEEGAQVVLTDILDKEGDATAKALGENARFMHHDVTSETEWHKVVAETEALFGPVTVLVNNAGIGESQTPIDELSEANYRRVIDINQIAVFLGMKAAVPSMKRAGGGSIINISSVAGLVGTAELHAYTASKFAVRGMTKSAAIELGRFNIRVNSVHPGVTRTPMADIPDTQGILDELAENSPLGRVAEPEEISAAIIMLASDEGGFATGAEFIIDGGISCQ